MTQQFNTQAYTQENWKYVNTKYLNVNVCSSMIHNNQKVETTQMSISW